MSLAKNQRIFVAGLRMRNSRNYFQHAALNTDRRRRVRIAHDAFSASFTNQRAVGANADERIRMRIAHPTPAWPGSEVSILIEHRGSNEGINGTSTPIEGADYRNGFGHAPWRSKVFLQKVAFGISPKYVFSGGWRRIRDRARPTNGSDRGALPSHDLTLFVSRPSPLAAKSWRHLGATLLTPLDRPPTVWRPWARPAPVP